MSRNRLKVGGEAKVSLMDFYRASLSKETIKRDLFVQVKQNMQDRFEKVQNYDMLDTAELLERQATKKPKRRETLAQKTS